LPKLNLEEMRKLDLPLLEERVIQMKVDLARLKATAERGSVKKIEGKVRPARRNVARLLTLINEMKGARNS